MTASSSLLVISALAISVYIVKLVWIGQHSRTSKLPGPWYSKYTNLVLRYHILSGRRIFYVDNLHQRYGGVVRIAPNEVAVADLAGVSQIHKVGSGFLKSAFYEKLRPAGSPLGIFGMRDPHAHAARRKLFARAFSNSSLTTNWELDIRQTVQKAIQQIKQNATSSPKGADVLKWWTLMATDIVAHLSFGESFNMLESGKATPYIDALQAALLQGVLRVEAPVLHALLRYIPNERLQRTLAADDVVAEYGSLAFRNMRSAKVNTLNLFGHMLAACDDGEKVSLTEEDVRSEAANLIVAGSDTTAVTLTYLVWAVLKHPSLQSRLEEEVSGFSDQLSLAELEAAPVLNSVIEETLRLYCAVPGALPRMVPGQGMTVGGHYVPGGVEVSTQAYTNHRDSQVFREPLSFDGFRFLERSRMTPQEKASYMPFGGGSRACIGVHLAKMELRLGVAMFFKECRGATLSDCMRDEMMDMDNRFLIMPKGHCCYVTLK